MPRPDLGEARELRDGQVLAGRFRITAFIARGGMGEVYAADDLRAQGRVALKTIRAPGASSAEMIERFRREVDNAKRVASRHVCRIYDIHYHDPRRYPEYIDEEPTNPITFLTMEFLAGETLSHAIRRRGKIPVQQALAIFGDIAIGLDAIHAAGVIHRDLKSSNVILMPAAKPGDPGVAKITDFGLARRLNTDESTESSFTQIGHLIGTPEYMAPEIRFQLQPATVESDIYSLGVIMHQMLTGRLPLPASESSPMPTTSVLSTLVPELPRRWERITLRCLEQNPANRFHSVSEVLGALEKSERRRTHIWAAIAAIVGVLALVWVTLRGGFIKPRTTSSGRVSVAVFGFKNLAGSSRVANLSSAFATGLAAELRAVEDLKVIPGEDVSHVKLNLKLPEVESYSADTLQRIRATTGADLVLLGSYLAGASANGVQKVRLYVVAQNTTTAEEQASVQEEGLESDLPTLISRSVDDLRAKLHLHGRSPEQERLGRSALPKNSEALRLYSQAVDVMHTFDLPAAEKLLNQAIEIEPSYAPAHAELAQVLSNLGQDNAARQQAELALSLSGSLPREQRLLIEGQYYDTHAKWDKAIESYQTLFNFFPDNLKYGLLLASVQSGPPALKTVARLRGLSPPLRDDPRIDIREAAARSNISDYPQERIVAARAAAKARQLGLLGQVAEAESWEAHAEDALGHGARAAQLELDCKQISESLHDDISAAAAVRGLALIKYDQGDLVGAAVDLTAALSTAERVGSSVALARGLVALGDVRLAQGRLAEATRLFERSLSLWRQMDNEINMGVALLDLGITFHRRGLHQEARNRLNQCLSVLQEGIGARFRARAFAELASIELDEHNTAQAQKLLDEAFENERGLTETVSMPKLLMTAGRLSRLTGALEQAAKSYERALNILTSSGQNGVSAQARLGLAEVELDKKGYSAGAALARQALTEFEREGRIPEAAYARAVVALCILGSGDSNSAGEMLAPARKIANQLEDPQVRYYIRAVEKQLASALSAKRSSKPSSLARHF